MSGELFDWPCSVGTSRNTRQRVRAARFGDGYRQQVKDGLNVRMRTWSVVLANIADDDADAASEFLDRNAGTWFYFTPPRAAEMVRVTCNEFDAAPAEGTLQTITATFEEYHAP